MMMLAAPSSPSGSFSSFGVYIGRFEPPHLAHLAVMEEALKQVDCLIIVLGSAQSPRTIKNPFTASERAQMILEMLSQAGIDPGRVRWVPVRDHLYDEQAWIDEVKTKVYKVIRAASPVEAPPHTPILIGHIKDESSYYLHHFPEWQFMPTKVISPLSATTVRNAYFSQPASEEWRELVPVAVSQFLGAFAHTREYQALQQDYAYLKNQSNDIQLEIAVILFASEQAKDAVWFISRESHPNQGTWSLPITELQRHETAAMCALRIAIEQLDTDPSLLHVEQGKLFDAPSRSLRGRVITYAIPVWTTDQQTDLLHTASEKGKARWISIEELSSRPELFFEDHHEIVHEIVQYFLKRPL